MDILAGKTINGETDLLNYVEHILKEGDLDTVQLYCYLLQSAMTKCRKDGTPCPREIEVLYDKYYGPIHNLQPGEKFKVMKEACDKAMAEIEGKNGEELDRVMKEKVEEFAKVVVEKEIERMMGGKPILEVIKEDPPAKDPIEDLFNQDNYRVEEIEVHPPVDEVEPDLFDQLVANIFGPRPIINKMKANRKVYERMK